MLRSLIGTQEKKEWNEMDGTRITLGLHLDGQRPVMPTSALGEIVVGPLGLLDILETQLGLLADHPPQSARIVQYRDCLRRADSRERFYHRSLATDELGTAAGLLAWRDEWHLHGWSGAMPENAPRRLADLAAVEGLARGQVAPSPGERLAAVIHAIAARTPAIREVRLLDPLEHFPARWREVLARLGATEVPPADAGAGKGFLGALQRSLRERASDGASGKLAWQDDGTVLFAQAETGLAAAAWAAHQLPGAERSLIVAEQQPSALDDALAHAGEARAGLKASSAFRPSLQVLPLAMELLWAPLNFHALVQFLTHPVCPIPGKARWRLAAKLADRPGIGGERWVRVLADIDALYGDRAGEVREAIAFWIEHERFGPEGAPIDFVLERVEALATFFRLRLGDEAPARRFAHQAGHSQCRAAAQALRLLRGQGDVTVRARQLQQLVDQATARGTDNPLRIAEAGAALSANHPGAAVEPVERVLWWPLAMPVMPAGYPWSRVELEALAAAGVQLPTRAERLAQAAESWLRPVMAARGRLILVLPPPGEEAHPLWQMIPATVESPPVSRIEDLLTAHDEASEPVPRRPLPTARRWWQLPEDVTVTMRECESYSSLELMIHNPYHWLLRYPAALKPSQLLSMGSEFRMLGNLAHALVEALYRRDDALTMSPAAFAQWFDATFPRLVEEEGALLLMPGRASAREGFRHALRRAVDDLRVHLAAADVVRVEPERAFEGIFPGGKLAGFADLFVETAQRGGGIVDLKWAGAKKYPGVLKENRHLQLAIYGELTRQKDGAWPALAYYVLNVAKLFAPDDRCFPQASVVESASGEHAPQLWLRFVESWKWRKAQLDAGRVEVALAAIEPTEASQPPAEAMAPETLNEAYNDYRVLAGWSH